jgi:DNA-directed RNA polymerase specialized sigma24 family protein
MSSVSRNIEAFEADPARGSFRAWLLQMARWRMSDQVAKRLPVVRTSCGNIDGTARTRTVERMPDWREVDLEALCDAEWRQRLEEEAFKQLQLEVSAEHYQIFYLLAVERKAPLEVAGMLGRSRAEVYVVRHRVGRKLKKIVKLLEKKLG